MRDSLNLSRAEAEDISFVPSALSIPRGPMFWCDNRCSACEGVLSDIYLQRWCVFRIRVVSLQCPAGVPLVFVIFHFLNIFSLFHVSFSFIFSFFFPFSHFSDNHALSSRSLGFGLQEGYRSGGCGSQELNRAELRVEPVSQLTEDSFLPLGYQQGDARSKVLIYWAQQQRGEASQWRPGRCSYAIIGHVCHPYWRWDQRRDECKDVTWGRYTACRTVATEAVSTRTTKEGIIGQRMNEGAKKAQPYLVSCCAKSRRGSRQLSETPAVEGQMKDDTRSTSFK